MLLPQADVVLSVMCHQIDQVGKVAVTVVALYVYGSRGFIIVKCIGSRHFRVGMLRLVVSDQSSDVLEATTTGVTVWIAVVQHMNLFLFA